MRAPLVLWLGLTMMGCATAEGGGGGDDTPDTGMPIDARVAVDSAIDAAQSPTDGAPIDAPTPDARPIDGAIPDAMPIDAPMPDARPIDAAMPDASMCVPPVAGPCDTSPQCGCTTTQNCVVIDQASGNTGCITAGTTQPYQRCTTNSQCTRGNSCFGGLCTPFCASGADCPGAYRMCKQAYHVDGGGATVPTPGHLYCTRTCDPLNPALDDATFDPCGSGLKCLPSNDRASDCFDLGSGGGMQDDFCGLTSADDSFCAPGYLCVSPIGLGFTCAKFCVIGGAACASGTCTGFGTAQFAGPNQIGVCL